MASTEPKTQPAAKEWLGDKATFASRSKTMFISFKGLQIVARKTLAADHVEFKYQFNFQNRPAPATKIIEMIKIDGAWRSGHTRSYDATWDAGSEIEPQP